MEIPSLRSMVQKYLVVSDSSAFVWNTSVQRRMCDWIKSSALMSAIWYLLHFPQRKHWLWTRFLIIACFHSWKENKLVSLKHIKWEMNYAFINSVALIALPSFLFVLFRKKETVVAVSSHDDTIIHELRAERKQWKTPGPDPGEPPAL